MSDPQQDPRIAQLIDAILQAASGDFNLALEPSTARDDLDAIIVGFNSMASRLGKLYSNLDRLVEERTELLVAAQKQLEELAYTDPLTSLANRAQLNRQLDARYEQIQRGEPESTLYVLDLDSFKAINDTHGHDMGDRVLVEIAQRLKQTIREQDIAARLGGDEFAVLVGVTGQAADDFAERLLTDLNEPIFLDAVMISPGISIGYTTAQYAKNYGQWMHHADTAMYVAKRAHGSKTQRYMPYMLAERTEKAHLIADLREALTKDELHVEYQPIWNVVTGRLTALEALIRWTHPIHEKLSPAAFLPLATVSGLMPMVRDLVLRQSLTALARWRSEDLVPEDCVLQVNISPHALIDPNFISQLRQGLEHSGIPAENLAIEITEDQYITDEDVMAGMLPKISELGVKIHIDDFGAGFSSYGYLTRLPIHGVKIDRSITSSVDTDPRQRAVLKAMVELARACNFECIVEGVETQKQLDVLKEVGVQLVQGFYLGRPALLPPENTELYTAQ